MRSLIKRLAGTGLTVLLSSHDMSEVEEICDNVTIMRTGSVVYHGEISELRQRAPEQGHRVSTDDDQRALALAQQHPDLVVTEAENSGLVVAGRQSDVDAYVRALVTAGLTLRGLELTEAPLETLFFMLTETAPGGVPTDLDHHLTRASR
jgi:ABC-2 type transport system ATP-binding protein